MTVPITIVGIHIGQGWLAGKHGRRGIQVRFNHGRRSGRASTHSIIRSDRTRFIRGMRTAKFLQKLLHPGYGETYSDNIVRHSVAEKGVYGINQKIKEGKHNTHSTDDSSEDTTSNDAAARSTGNWGVLKKLYRVLADWIPCERG